MFMQFLGSRIGHKVTDYVQQSPIRVPYEEPKLLDRDIIPHNTQTHAPTELEEGDDANGDPEAMGDGDTNREPEEVDTDEEADYGYMDGHESKGKNREGEDSKGGDSEGKEGNDLDDDNDDDEVL